MTNISIQPYPSYNEIEILNLYKSVEWANYYKNPEMLKKSFLNSLYILGAYDSKKLIGIIRVVGDGHSIIYIQDILVLPEYQHKKVGTKLIEEILKKYKNVYQKILVTDNTDVSINFYKSLGFINLAELGCVGFQHLEK